MYCPKCKINYNDNSKVCLNCDSILLHGLVCRECNTRNPEDSTVCNLCGFVFTEKNVSKIKTKESKYKEPNLKSYKKICKKYGHINDSENIFCSECGGVLEHIPEKRTAKRQSIFKSILSLLT